MSQSVTQTHYNVRLLIDDVDADQYAISIPKMSVIIAKAVQLIAVRSYQSLSAAPTSLALVAGTTDYSLAASPTAIRQVILNSDGVPLDRIPLEQLNEMFRQDTAVSAGRGIPRYYAVYDVNNPASGADTTCKIRVGPTPSAADSLKIYYDLIPTRNTGNYIENAAAVIPFSPPLVSAVESTAAAECVASMDDDDIKRRKISRGYAQVLLQNAERMILESNFRQRMMEAQDEVDEVNSF
jgi:hypothetical protein